MIPNPYIVGGPIHDPNMFFGRESLLGVIEDNLRQNVKFILLHGHRRIGKTSVLKQIPNHIAGSEFVFVHFDLQDRGRSEVCDILHKLTEEIVHQLELNQDHINVPAQRELKTDLNIFSRKFLHQVYQELDDKKLVLLLDEFDVMSDDPTNILDKGRGFFRYLETLLKQQENLFIIAVSGRRPDDLPNLLHLFNGVPPHQEIGFLDDLSAKRLIRRPTQGFLEYDQDAITAILELTAGHPYYIQVICFNIFILAKNNKTGKVIRADVENVIETAIGHADGALTWFSKELTIPEKVVLSAVVEAQRNVIHKVQRLPEKPLTLLKNYGVIQTDELVQATSQLAYKGFLDDTERRVKIEFVRLWLEQSHPLRQEIWELEKSQGNKVNSLCEVAIQLHQEGDRQQALDIYNQALALNPNHFSTVLELAELNLELKNFDTALQLYERAYKVDPIGNKEALLSALETYGSELTTQRQYSQAKEQYNRVLDIQIDRVSAQQRLAEIQGYESRRNSQFRTNNSSQDRLRRIPLSKIAAVAGIIAFVGVGGIGFYKWSTPCPVGQKKMSGIVCVAESNPGQENNITNNISRGDRTLFPTIPNPYRDQGIKAFKQGNYQQAVNDFAQAVQYNRNDPEVLIYYNNALARKQGSLFTLAVVVPAENLQSIAQEILRGVALSQNQFNANGGLNRHLLEIIIANDANNSDQAKQVAQQLVDDQSVLAVIGHYTSDTTGAALDEYQKAKEPLAVISPTATSSQLQSNIFFRTTPSNVKAGSQLAEYIWKKLGLKKVVIFYNRDSQFSKDIQKQFTNNFKELGGQVVWNIDLTEPNLDPDQKLNESVSKYQAQAALLFPEGQQTSMGLKIAKAKANSKNPKVQSLQLLGDAGTLYSDQTLTNGGNAVEGLILSVPWFRETPQSKDFAQEALQQWGGGVSWRTATSYDATQALIQALSSNPSRSTVLQKLRQVNLSPQQTSGDALKFTPQGEIQMKPILIQVQGDQFKILL